MRNSDQSNSSQRRGQKSRKPTNRSGPRGASGQRSTTSNNNSNGQGTGTGQRKSSSQGKSRNEISQAWASDTSTLSSHMPTAARNDRNSKGRKTENNANPRARGKNKPTNAKNRSGKNERSQSRSTQPSRPSNVSTEKQPTQSNPAEKQPAQSNPNTAPRAGGKQVGNIDPFELFCAYHLGITQDKGYRTSNINEVANRFRSEPGMVKQALKEYDMDPESLLNRDFDMGLAQLDIQVAPEGVDRLELARGIYQDFQDAPRIKRDWNKLLEEDRKENQKIFKD